MTDRRRHNRLIQRGKMAEFTHFNESGRARMVDVSAKAQSERVATAQAKVYLQPETLQKIQRGKIAKGDVLAVAQVAGVMGAKKTPDLIPMCHPLFLSSVDISFTEEPQPDRDGRCAIIVAQASSARAAVHERGPGRTARRGPPVLACVNSAAGRAIWAPRRAS